MADDLSLLFKIRGDAAGAKQATAETRAAVASLRSQLGGEFNAMQSAGQSALANLGNSVNVFIGQRLPLLGGGFLRVTENLKGFGAESAKGTAQLANLNKTIDGLAASTGKSRGAITSFLTSFVQLETQAKRDAAAIETFGVSVAQKLIPQLEKAGTEMATVAATTTSTSAAMAGAVPIIGIVVVAAAALTVGVIALTKEFFSLVHATAGFQGKMFDLSQQTGVSVETLSALEIVAKTTGGSIESIAQSLVIFQGKLDDAQDASSETGKKFAELGISTDNTEQAFRDALSVLAKMPEGFHQTNEAAELFGRRGGKQVLAILKELDGDLDGAIAKFRAMGLIISKESAKAADEFNDQLAILGFQIRGTTALLVQDAIPHILSALKETSRLFKENREAIIAVASAVTLFVDASSRILVAHLRVLQLALDAVRTTWMGIKSLLAAGITGNISIVMEIFQAFKGQQQTLATLGQAQASIQGEGLFPGVSVGITEPRKGGGGGRGAAAKKASEGQQLLNQLTEEYNRLQEKELQLTKFQIIEKELLNKKYKDLSPALREAILELATYIAIDQQEAEEKKKNIETNKQYLAVIKEIRENMNRTLAARIDLEAKIAEAVQSQREALSELQGFEKSHLQIVEEFIAKTVREAEAIGGVTEKMREYFALLIKIAAKQDEIIANKRRFEGVEGDAEGSGPGNTESAIDQLFKHINDNLTGTKQSAALAGLAAMTEAFAALGQAVGSSLQAFILYGNAGTSFRKFAAEVISAVAVMAATKAIFELAEGFAMLALNFFWPDPRYAASATGHFHAAAIYGAIAGVAAVAGRAVAGNAFGGASGGGGGGAGGGGAGNNSGGSSNNGSSAPITMGSQRPQVVIHKFIPPPGYGEQIVIAALDSNHPEVRRLLAREDR